MSVETYVYVVEGIDLEGEVPQTVRRAAMRAVNYATARARTSASKAIRRDVALPARYLSGAEGRLQITERAKLSSLESNIVGRRRPTSLARYSRGSVLSQDKQRRSKGVKVTVKPGVAKFIRRGFLIKLRGAGGELNNIGLAVRTDGGPPRGAFKPKKLSENLYLLYGLSVDVLFRRAVDPISPDILNNLQNEFARQLSLDDL